jgi:lysylphosphatidylglycerol synthetase-like protein (DUF2156 family)
MSIVHRLTLVPLATLLAVGLLGTTPAQASFGDSTATPVMQMTTTTVAAPGAVKGSLTCGSSSATMAASWTASTTPQVAGYVVSVYFDDGYVQTVPLAATATSWSAGIGIFYVTGAGTVQYSVTTQTSYGWTKESARTAVFHC